MLMTGPDENYFESADVDAKYHRTKRLSNLSAALDSPNLKVGDKVKLKSGGPVMVIAKITEDKIEAIWFDDDADLESAEFPIQTLDEVG